MHPAARHALLLTIPAMSLLLALARAPTARGEPTLELPNRWYRVVAPYRYEEARRFERGWNRGADVLVVGSTIRSPVFGRVRFAGEVAGRRVVTVATVVDGQRAVFTVTGASTLTVRAGDAVDAGERLGSGMLVHVGAYDPGRRSRYLPVVSGNDATATVANGPDGVPAPGSSGSPLGDAVADRLRAAILGIPGPGHVPITGPRLGGIGRPVASGAGHGEIDAISIPRSFESTMPSDQRPASVPGFPTHRPSVMPRVRQFVLVAARTVRTMVDRAGRADVARTRHRHRDAHIRGDDGAATQDRPSSAPERAAGDRSVIPVPAWRLTPAASARVAATSPPGRSAGAVASMEAVGVAGQPRPAPDSTDVPRTATVAGILLLVAGALVALARRRRIQEAASPPWPEPVLLEVHLPDVRPYAYPVLRCDGASVLADVALAWPDTDPGTSPGTPPSSRESDRAPEHA